MSFNGPAHCLHVCSGVWYGFEFIGVVVLVVVVVALIHMFSCYCVGYCAALVADWFSLQIEERPNWLFKISHASFSILHSVIQNAARHYYSRRPPSLWDNVLQFMEGP